MDDLALLIQVWVLHATCDDNSSIFEQAFPQDLIPGVMKSGRSLKENQSQRWR